MTDQRIRIGIIGAGKSALNTHVPRFQAIDQVEVTGIVNRTNASSNKAADQLGIHNIYQNWIELLDDPNIDAIFVGTWPYMHKTLVLEALKRNKHVLTQARMSMNLNEARDMLTASLQKPQVITQIVPSYMADQAVIKTIMELVNGGSVGKILSIDFCWSYNIAKNNNFTWRHDPDMVGKNIMMIGAQYENLMRIFGPAINVTAFSNLVRPSLRDQIGRTEISTIPDHAEIIAEMETGAVLHMRLSGIIGMSYPCEMWIFATKGTIRCVLNPPATVTSSGIWVGYQNQNRLTDVPIQYPLGDKHQTEIEFIESIRGNCQARETTFENGVRYMEFTESVFKSIQNQDMVHLID